MATGSPYRPSYGANDWTARLPPGSPSADPGMAVQPYADPGYGMPNAFVGNLNQAPGMAVGGYLPVNALQPGDLNADNPLAQAPSWADAYGSVSGTVSSGVDALGQWLAAQRAKQDRPPVWSMANPVGTETTRQPQQLTMPTPGVQDVAFWGGQPVSQQFKDTAQSAIGNALGWVGSAGPRGPIRAFHGSPYDFERFDTAKIGTGEGAQAYGHGLYFAEKEGTAQTYRDNLTPADAGFNAMDSVLRRFAGWQPAAADVREAMTGHDVLTPLADNPDVVDAVRRLAPDYSPSGAVTGDALRHYRTINDAIEAAAPKGSMYEVNIGADPEQFLHWDKPISEQSPQIQDLLDQHGIARRENQPYITGQDVHDFLSPKGDYAAGAQRLKDLGIPGIRYLDQGSRGAGEGTHNYVVFDANTIDILRKYGIAGLGLGLSGAAATGGTQQQPPMAQ